ncbi:ATP-dependent nuclease [Plantactinospora sp. WMMB782]|uniref:ATP-dependent nuclease n=1 Tax=Plantactinospora sp. WMMB782 TaxID=3404121 RepID=UPI003B9463C1
MVLRFIERRHQIAKLTKREYTTFLTVGTFITTAGLTQTLSFSPGISVVSGGNGAGKSTLLGAAWRCLTGLEPQEGSTVPGVPAWLGELRISGTHAGVPFEAEFYVDSGSKNSTFPSSVFYIDPAAETEEVLRHFRSDPQSSDLLEGVDPASFDSNQLQSLAYILRREYSEFLVYEVTAFSADDTPFPYFEVTSMGKRYTLQQMGRGELVAAYLLWRLQELPSGAVVLLEEPESHLAAFSQDKLVDTIVSIVVERDLCVVVSSHSPGFFQKLPAEHVVLVSSLPSPSIYCGLSTSELANHLGVQPRTAAVVLVEDQVAAEFFHAILSALDRDALRHLDVRAVASGQSGVKRIVSEVSSSVSDQVRILGVLDGDQRPRSAQTSAGKIGYLVGDSAPEVLLRETINRWRLGEYADWSSPLPGGNGGLRLCLERLDGRDLHDWMFELAEEFGGLRPTVRAITELVLRDPSLKTQCEDMVTWLRSQGRLPS